MYMKLESTIYWKANLDGQYGSGRGVLSLPSLSKNPTMKRSGGCWRGLVGAGAEHVFLLTKFAHVLPDSSAHRDTSVPPRVPSKVPGSSPPPTYLR